MSLSLGLGTRPHGLLAKAWSEEVWLGDYEISMKDFLCLAHYVLTNADLLDDDPRLQFVRCIQSMREIEGWNTSGKRLQASLPPVQ